MPETNVAAPVSESRPTLGGEPTAARGILPQVTGSAARVLRVDGVQGGLAPALAVAWAAPSESQPLIYLVADDELVGARRADLGFLLGVPADPASHLDNQMPRLLPTVAAWPAPEENPYSEMQPDRRGIMQRLAILAALDQGQSPSVLVVSARGLFRRVVPPESLRRFAVTVTKGATVSRDELAAAFERAGYGRAPVVEDVGTFAVRGAVLDVFPPCYDKPIRIELFGDDVDSIRQFEPATQRTWRELPRALVHPVRETLVGAGADPRARLLEAADAASQPSGKTRHMLDQIEQGAEFLGIEALAPLFHSRMANLLECLPAGARLAIEDPQAVFARLEADRERCANAARKRLADHRIALPVDSFLLSRDEAHAMVNARARLLLSSLVHATVDQDCMVVSSQPAALTRGETHRAAVAAQGGTEAGDRAEGQLARRTRKSSRAPESDPGHAFAARLRGWLTDGYRIRLVAATQAHAERLNAMLDALELSPTFNAVPGNASESASGPPAGAGHLVRWLQDEAPDGPVFELLVGSLSTGFVLPLDRLVIVTEEDIFGKRARRENRKAARGGDLLRLREGDAVVHDQHGVGLYRGLRKLDVRGVVQDYLQLEYEDGTAYVPVYRLGLVRPFVSGVATGDPSTEGETRPLRLDRLGGKTWQEKRRRASGEARKMAEELLQLYAQRHALPGHACVSPDAVFGAFEETFPFEETPDQAKAITAVLDDLQSDRPMDRLVCGDVGYGKTEVALRAALLAVLSGKQVAVLAPTTILVEQHLATFRERFEDFPVRVAALSRFRPPAEQRATVAELANGKLDVVIGTHRLLSRDVRFSRLGLVIIDEEQRFGVAHKERLKTLRTETDVLTLTATPIPRTLQMAMGGLREISIIATPPTDRLAIRTFVCAFDPELLREAIERELSRGGQVFFVHNRVQDLDHWADQVRALAPRARVAVAHGQMNERALESIMVDFVDGRFDILCCTTIIESGLDIPRANTMIVNRADRFGLAQLYQLRGRIGRARERAYCLLVVPDDDKMTDDARRRIGVLQRFSELGAGFQIASHDLEIRGAGELLGAKQSGALAAVGFETYARILEEAVAELRGQPLRTELDPEINVDVPAFLPDDYIPDTGQRLDAYRRLAQATEVDDVQGILTELIDRFGPLPEEAELLGIVMIDKTIVRRLGALSYDLQNRRFVLAFDAAHRLDPARILRLVQGRDSRFKLAPDNRLSYHFSDGEQGGDGHQGWRHRLSAARARLLQIESETLLV